jgi:hypothetical protein
MPPDVRTDAPHGLPREMGIRRDYRGNGRERPLGSEGAPQGLRMALGHREAPPTRHLDCGTMDPNLRSKKFSKGETIAMIGLGENADYSTP